MDLDKEGVSRALSAVLVLHTDTARFFNKHGIDPSPGSQAISELSAFPGEFVRVAYAQGESLIRVSADQLIALLRSLTEPVLTVAPWTSVRAGLESCALASWVFDPGIGVRERVQRSFAFRFEGLSQQVKFMRASHLDTSKALSRICDVEKCAADLGFPRVQDSKGRRIGIGQKFPVVTDLIGLTLGEEPAYRLLSAFVHSHTWAIQQGSFTPAQESTAEQRDFAENTVYLQKALQPVAILFLCHTAAYAFSRPIWYKAQLYGYDVPELRTILNGVFDHLCVGRDHRFWNPA